MSNKLIGSLILLTLSVGCGQSDKANSSPGNDNSPVHTTETQCSLDVENRLIQVNLDRYYPSSKDSIIRAEYSDITKTIENIDHLIGQPNCSSHNGLIGNFNGEKKEKLRNKRLVFEKRLELLKPLYKKAKLSHLLYEQTGISFQDHYDIPATHDSEWVHRNYFNNKLFDQQMQSSSKAQPTAYEVVIKLHEYCLSLRDLKDKFPNNFELYNKYAGAVLQSNFVVDIIVLTSNLHSASLYYGFWDLFNSNGFQYKKGSHNNYNYNNHNHSNNNNSNNPNSAKKSLVKAELCELLGIAESSSDTDIGKAVRKAQLNWHPDRTALNPSLTDEERKIRTAKSVKLNGLYYTFKNPNGSESSDD